MRALLSVAAAAAFFLLPDPAVARLDHGIGATVEYRSEAVPAKVRRARYKVKRAVQPSRSYARQPVRQYGEARDLGGRPAACWRFPKTVRLWCGCAAAIEVGLHNPDGFWNLSSNWFVLPRAAPGYNKAAVRSGHVAILKHHVSGTIWMAYDPNSGGQRARLRPIDISRYPAVVDPHGAPRRRAMLPMLPFEVTAEDRPHPLLGAKPAVDAPDPDLLMAFATVGEFALESIRLSLDDARAYLVRTATVGTTMRRQTPEKSIAWMHPKFVERAAAAFKEARAAGMPHVGCFSAYRMPVWGIGGYRNKFDSNHAYGLYCDVAGIGRPGSVQAKLWHKIATKHKLYNPYYGTRAYWEWNHYGVTPTVKAVAAVPALRKTITAWGPKDAPEMWRVADVLIDNRIGGVPRVGKKKRQHVRWAAAR